MSRYIKFGAIAAGGIMALSACGAGMSYGGGGSATHQSQSKAAAGATLQVRTTSLGKVLVDKNGMTLYLFKADKPNQSTCSTQCLTYWPAAAAPKAGAKLSGVTGKVGSAKAADGSSIATVGGWPLYTFVKDQKPGDVTGQGIDEFGAKWYAVSPSGKPVEGTASSAPTSSSGGNGY